VLNIEYTHKSNIRVTNIVYNIVAIIKRICNYKNNLLAVNIYYQILWELKKIKEAETVSEITSITKSSKGLSTLNHIWFNIKNLWKEKKKKKSEELEKYYHILLLPLLTNNSFNKINFKPVFDSFKLGEKLLAFDKKKKEKSSNRGLI